MATRTAKAPAVKKGGKPQRLWTELDLIFAFECAADFLENEEWPDEDGGAQVAAYREAARRVRRMATRVLTRRPRPQTPNRVST